MNANVEMLSLFRILLTAGYADHHRSIPFMVTPLGSESGYQFYHPAERHYAPPHMIFNWSMEGRWATIQARRGKAQVNDKYKEKQVLPHYYVLNGSVLSASQTTPNEDQGT